MTAKPDYVREWAEKLQSHIYRHGPLTSVLEAAARELLAMQKEEDVKLCELIASTGGSAVHCVEAIRKGKP